jgi:hypothetical protein
MLSLGLSNRSPQITIIEHVGVQDSALTLLLRGLCPSINHLVR